MGGARQNEFAWWLGLGLARFSCSTDAAHPHAPTGLAIVTR
jgi:hypothetical protein